MPGYLVPQLRQGELPAFVQITFAGSLQPADDPIADIEDLCDDGVIGKPAVEKDKPSINACLPAAFKHMDQHIGFLLKGLSTPFPSIAAPVHLFGVPHLAFSWMYGS